MPQMPQLQMKKHNHGGVVSCVPLSLPEGLPVGPSTGAEKTVALQLAKAAKTTRSFWVREWRSTSGFAPEFHKDRLGQEDRFHEVLWVCRSWGCLLQ